MFSPAPVVIWVATAIYFVCAYPISPPEEVRSLFASAKIARIFFTLSTLYLVVQVFKRGNTCRRCAPKERRIRRVAYTWLCGVVLIAYAAVNHLVRLGGDYITMPLLTSYGAGLALLVGIFFCLRYWQSSAGKR